MGRSYNGNNSYYSPFYGWETQLVELIDDSSPHARKSWNCAAGLLKLLPHYNPRRISWGHLDDIGLDVAFRCYDDARIEFLRSLTPGDWLIVDGELHKRCFIQDDPYPKIDSGCHLKDIQTDPWQGTRAPSAAFLYTSDDEEFHRTLALARVSVVQPAH